VIIRDEKAELLQIINSIPAENYEKFGPGIGIEKICRRFNGSKLQAESFLLQLEREGKIEIYRIPEMPNSILVVRPL